MSKRKVVKTAWGSKQVEVPGLPELTRDEEVTLRQEWRTPNDFCNVLDGEFKFDIDVAASIENTLCEFHIDIDENALSTGTPWVDPSDGLLRAYCNPGFGNMMPWLEKAISEADRDPSVVVCVLGLCAPSTKWWTTAVHAASEIRLLSPRVQFQAPDQRIPQSSNARDCALFIFRGGGKPLGRSAHITTWRWK